MSSYLEICFGPMFSGKTSYLLSIIIDNLKKNKKILYVNSDKDIRATTAFSTHNPHYRNIKFDSPNIMFIKSHCLANLDYEPYDIILIDEAQFFEVKDDLKDTVQNLVKLFNKTVYVGGLISDYNCQRFGNLLDLCVIADSIKILKADCQLCNGIKQNASFTKRTTPDTEQIVVGDDYMPVCRFHYYN